MSMPVLMPHTTQKLWKPCGEKAKEKADSDADSPRAKARASTGKAKAKASHFDQKENLKEVNAGSRSTMTMTTQAPGKVVSLLPGSLCRATGNALCR